jgi:hypothetical protein
MSSHGVSLPVGSSFGSNGGLGRESRHLRRGGVAGQGGRRPDLEKGIGFSTVELMMNVSRPI